MVIHSDEGLVFSGGQGGWLARRNPLKVVRFGPDFDGFWQVFEIITSEDFDAIMSGPVAVDLGNVRQAHKPALTEEPRKIVEIGVGLINDFDCTGVILPIAA